MGKYTCFQPPHHALRSSAAWGRGAPAGVALGLPPDVAMRLLLLVLSLCALALPVAGQSVLEPRPAWPDTSAILLRDAPLGPDSLLLHVPETMLEVSRWRIASVGLACRAAGLCVLETLRRRWWEDRTHRFCILND